MSKQNARGRAGGILQDLVVGPGLAADTGQCTTPVDGSRCLVKGVRREKRKEGSHLHGKNRHMRLECRCPSGTDRLSWLTPVPDG
jgi:hypothetical protein